MLQVRDLACGRGGWAILSGLNFTLSEGQVLILRGPNGVGKTTLLRTLAGLQPAVAGEIEVDEASRAYASHADGIKAALTARENLTFWAQIHGTTLEEATLDRFNLRWLADRPAGTLSAGQKRRLGLARLDVIGRKLLLLDEPTVSLDDTSIATFTDWLKARHLARGGAAVIATHVDIALEATTLDLGGHIAVHDWPDEAFAL